MANKVSITNNVTQHTVEVSAGSSGTNLVVSQNTNNNTLQLNAGLALPSATPNLEDLLNVSAGASIGQVIEYDGSNWQPITLDIPANNIADSGALTGQILIYDGTNWVPGDNVSDTSSQLTSDINVTDTVGNVLSGTTLTTGTELEDIFNTMLVSYQLPVMSLSGWFTTIAEHGSLFSDSNFVLAFTNDSNIDAAVSGTWSFVDAHMSNNTGTAAASDGSTSTGTITGTYLVTDTNAGTGVTQRTGAASLTVSGFQDTNGDAIAPRTVTSTVRYRYWVVDSTVALTPDFVSDNQAQAQLAITDSGLDGTGAGVIESGLLSSLSTMGFTAAGNHDYVFWIFPQAFTVSSVVMNGSVNLYAGDTADKTTAVIHMGTFNIDNQHGETVAMQMLRSKVNNAFAPGTVITVS